MLDQDIITNITLSSVSWHIRQQLLFFYFHLRMQILSKTLVQSQIETLPGKQLYLLIPEIIFES